MRNLKKTAIYTLFLLLALALLYFSFRGIEWKDFIGGLESCNFLWIAGSMAVSIAVSYIRAVRWRLLLTPINRQITVAETFDGVNIGYLTNFVLPRAGEVTRCGIVAGTGKVSFESTLGSVVVERAVDLISMTLILLSLFFINWNEFGRFIQDTIFDSLSARLGSALVVAMIAAVFSIPLLLYLFRKYNSRLEKIPVLGKISSMVCRLTDGLMSWTKMKRKWEFCLHTILIWIGYWLMAYFTILAFPAVSGLNASDALFLMIAGSLGWLVPVQGGIGAYHFVVSLALSTVYGITQTNGIIFATISHTSQSIIMILCGLYSLIAVAVRKHKKERTAEKVVS